MTAQVELINLYRGHGDDRMFEQLTGELREPFTDYCYQRLGIENALDTRVAFEHCKEHSLERPRPSPIENVINATDLLL